MLFLRVNQAVKLYMINILCLRIKLNETIKKT